VREELATQLIEWSKKAVKEKLKSPSTAKFAGLLLERGDYRIYTMPDGSYRVVSWVDAQNSFGAMLRNHWAVKFKKNGEQWEILSVVVE